MIPFALYGLVLLLSTLTLTFGLLALSFVLRRSRPAEIEALPVSVLKPLCGADDALEENLASFFELSYPHFELVFGVAGDDDPAIEVVKKLRARHPSVPVKLLVHSGGPGLNPKVANLRMMISRARHDVVVISDSNIRVPKRYLWQMLAKLVRPRVGLVTSLFRGMGEKSVGATLDNLQLNGSIASSIAASSRLGCTFAVGKSMMFRRSQLSALGGLDSLSSVLAEDYVMGRMFRAAGYEVALADHTVDNICVDASVAAFLGRHLRWALLRSRLKPLAYPFELLLNPVAMALWAPLFGWSLWITLCWALALTMLRDAVAWTLLRGGAGLPAALLLTPLKELSLLAVFLLAPFLRVVSWRGRSFRVSAGTRLYAFGTREGVA